MNNENEIKIQEETRDLNYKDVGFDVDDFRDLTIQERKIFVQRFIDIMLYDPEKFRTARRLLLRWENLNQSENGKDNH